MIKNQIDDYHVPESRFGKWFLRTETWSIHVLDRAIQDLESLIPDRKYSYPVVVDVGCGYGRSLKKLHDRFLPSQLIGVDIDPEMIEASNAEISQFNIDAKLVCCSSSSIDLENNSVDLLFCHQSFHHMVLQEQAIAEFFRILKPEGIMLFAESTKRYIQSWIIRWLFRHPQEVQKTSDQYLTLIRKSGFQIHESSISYPFLWWSREDLGILENWFGISPPSVVEQTLINLVATKPVYG